MAQSVTPDTVAALCHFAKAVLEGAERGEVASADIQALGITYGLLIDRGLRGADDTGDPHCYRLAPWLESLWRAAMAGSEEDTDAR